MTVIYCALYQLYLTRLFKFFLLVFRPAAALPALADLRLTSARHREVQVAWQAHREGLKGYWLTWERESSHSSSSKPSVSSIYLPPTSHSTQLTHLAPSSRVCVSPTLENVKL